MTLSDVSERTGLSRAEISKLENGFRPLRADHLIRFSEAFGTRAEELAWPDEAQQLLRTTITRGHDRLPIRGRASGHIIVDFDKTFGECELTLPNGLSRGGMVVYNPRTDLKFIPVGALLVLTTVAPPRAGELVVKVRDKDNTAEVEPFDGHRTRGHEVYRVAAVLPQ